MWIDHDVGMTITLIRRENLRALIAESGGPAKTARKLHISNTQMSQIAGPTPTRGIGNRLARRIEDAYKKPTGWMDTPQAIGAQAAGINWSRRIPLISYAAAALGRIPPSPLPAGMDYLQTDVTLSDGAFALEVDGESMRPDFAPGDRIIIDPAVLPTPGDFVVAKTPEGAVFRKYRPRGADAFELVPLNDDFATVPKDETIQLLGTMMEHRRYRKPR